MDALEAIYILATGCVIYKIVQDYKERRKKKTEPQPVTTGTVATQYTLHPIDEAECDDAAVRYGWAVLISSLGGIEFKNSVRRIPNGLSELEVRTLACSVLLGDLRDMSPDPIVADKAADLLITLNKFARTTSRN